MDNGSMAWPGRDTSTARTFRRLRGHLAEALGIPPDEVTPDHPFEALIPPGERRRVWRELAEAGYRLPDLGLPGPVAVAAALVVVVPLAALALALKDPFVLLSLVEAVRVARRVTRRRAVRLPVGCQTVYEAVLHLTPFTRADHEAGLWPREEIAAKVRWVVARSTGTPFAEVKEETRLVDLRG